MDELSQVTERQRAMWGAGDYVPFGEMLLPSSGRLVEAAGVAPRASGWWTWAAGRATPRSPPRGPGRR